MKTYWSIGALLILLLTPACGGRTPEPAKSDEGAAVATERDQNVQLPAPTESQAASPQPASAAAPQASRAATRTLRTTAERSPAPTSLPERAVPPPAGVVPPRVDEERAAPPPPAPEWRELTVPAGTALPLELLTALSSETARVETPVRARLRQAVVVNGYTALPAGAVLTGHVIDVERSGRVEGRARLALTFDRVQMENVTEDILTNPISFVAQGTKGEDATKIAGGAVGGAIVGGILGGGKGAAKGAAIGGGAGTGVVLATRGKEVELAAGTDIAASLSEPFTIRLEVR